MAACWVITDGAAGNENQALALAHGLDFQPRVFRVALKRPWSWLAPFGPRDPRHALTTIPDGFAPPWPDLAIGCGRASALAVLGLKRLSDSHTRVVQILDPRWRRARFDALIVPEHDGLTGSNVVASIGSLNRIDDAWLADGRDRFDRLGGLSSPRTAVLIGGPVDDVPFDDAYIGGLLDTLATWQARDSGSFLVTCSRRTPPALTARLRGAFAAYPGIFWAGGDDGENPYAGLLGWADRIVVTPDSSNLLSEACAVGVPVFTPLPGTLRGKRLHLVRTLIERGHLQATDGTGSPPGRPRPLRELARITAALRHQLDGGSRRAGNEAIRRTTGAARISTAEPFVDDDPGSPDR